MENKTIGNNDNKHQCSICKRVSPPPTSWDDKYRGYAGMAKLDIALPPHIPLPEIHMKLCNSCFYKIFSVVQAGIDYAFDTPETVLDV